MKTKKLVAKKINHKPKNKSKFASIAINVILAGSAEVSLPSYAIDIDAGDWDTAPAGTDMAIIYAQHVNRDQLFAKGNVAANNAQLESNISILRYVHWTTLGGHPFALEALLPFGNLKADGDISSLGNASGIGDAVFLAPIWLIDNKSERNSFAVVPYIFLPTGSYDKDKPLNLGENRMKYDLQLGYTHGIGRAFNIELAGDAMYFGENTDTSLNQKLLYQAQGHLSYQWNPGTRLAIGLSHSFGGETSISGIDQDNKINTTKALFTVSTFIDQRNQFLFSYGKDLSVSNGFKEESRFNFRLLHVF
ncbi:transporter [Pseudomonas sp. Y39-6]|uniref:transporter n=1 Tax=Pseudomonas sp. Y39-6 TaxID=2749807 RepID=UPI00191051EC|nr:transporter [Pseudomonas sp. Y39-6]QPO21797.1 transporter [Pseudomonas sp. Y39-6]URS59055.1 transporter [Pseudomonas sp. Y39-6]